MRIAVPCLQLHPNGIYYFRLTVPSDLRQVVGKREWRWSLRLREGDKAEAHRRVAKLSKEFDRKISELRRQLQAQEDPHVLAREAASWAATFHLLRGQDGFDNEVVEENGIRSALDSQNDLAFDAIVEEAGRKHGWDERGHPKHVTPQQEARLKTLSAGKPVRPQMTVSAACDAYVRDKWNDAEDKPTKYAVDQFISMVGDIPLDDIQRPAVAEWTRSLMEDRGQGVGTIKRRIGVMKAVFNHMIDNYGLKDENPFRRQSPPRGAKKPVERLPFNKADWEKINGYVPSLSKRDTRNILILLKHTGCRPLEIGGLSAKEVRLDEDIPFLRLEETSERGLKTGTIRIVPLVGDAVTAAKDALQHKRGDYLFAAGFRTTDGLSTALRETLRNAGVKSDGGRKVPYSYRHSLSEAFRVAKVSEEIRYDVLGHTEKGAAGGYGAKRRPLPMLRDALLEAIPMLGIVEDPLLYS